MSGHHQKYTTGEKSALETGLAAVIIDATGDEIICLTNAGERAIALCDSEPIAEEVEYFLSYFCIDVHAARVRAAEKLSEAFDQGDKNNAHGDALARGLIAGSSVSSPLIGLTQAGEVAAWNPNEPVALRHHLRGILYQASESELKSKRGCNMESQRVASTYFTARRRHGGHKAVLETLSMQREEEVEKHEVMCTIEGCYSFSVMAQSRAHALEVARQKLDADLHIYRIGKGYDGHEGLDDFYESIQTRYEVDGEWFDTTA